MNLPESEIVFLKGLKKDGEWIHVFSFGQEHLAEQTASVMDAKIEPYPIRVNYEMLLGEEFKFMRGVFRSWKWERNKG